MIIIDLGYILTPYFGKLFTFIGPNIKKSSGNTNVSSLAINIHYILFFLKRKCLYKFVQGGKNSFRDLCCKKPAPIIMKVPT